MVSTFKASRNHQLGLESFELLVKSLPDTELVLIGDGELEQTIAKEVARKGLGDWVRMVGYKTGPKYIEALQA